MYTAATDSWNDVVASAYPEAMRRMLQREIDGLRRRYGASPAPAQGWIRRRNRRRLNDAPAIMSPELTWAGHELLETMRSKPV